MKKALIFCDGSNVLGRCAKQSLELLASERVDVTSDDIRQSLRTGEYGLIVDTTTLMEEPPKTGAVNAFMRTMRLEEPPEVVCMY